MQPALGFRLIKKLQLSVAFEVFQNLKDSNRNHKIFIEQGQYDLFKNEYIGMNSRIRFEQRYYDQSPQMALRLRQQNQIAY